MPTELIKYDAARVAIRSAHRVDEVKPIRDKQANNKELERQAMEIRVRAERRAGQLLAETPKAKGGKPSNRSRVTTGYDEPKTLAKLGITKDQSSEWQKLAKVPDAEFEQAFVSKWRPSGRVIVRNGLHNLKVEHDEELQKSELVPSPSGATCDVNLHGVNWGNRRERERALKGTCLDTREEFAALQNIRARHPCSLTRLIEKALAGEAVSAIARRKEIEALIAADTEEYWEGCTQFNMKFETSFIESIMAASDAAGESLNLWITQACVERLARSNKEG